MPRAREPGKAAAVIPSACSLLGSEIFFPGSLRLIRPDERRQSFLFCRTKAGIQGMNCLFPRFSRPFFFLGGGRFFGALLFLLVENVGTIAAFVVASGALFLFGFKILLFLR